MVYLLTGGGFHRIFFYAVTSFTRYVVEGDASDEEVLKQMHLGSARAMITTLPEDADNLFVVLEEISCHNLASCFAGKSISELDVRNNSGANIIGLKREDKSYMINPVPETALVSSDKLFALETRSQISHLIKTITSDATGG